MVPDGIILSMAEMIHIAPVQIMLTLGFWATLLLVITTSLGALFIGKPEARDTARAWAIGIFRRIFKGK